MNKKTCIALCASLLAAAGFANAQATFAEKNITLDAAMEMARASLDDCRAKGFKVTVPVFNRHARNAVVVSDDGVNPHTIENSMRKAYTAFTTKGPSVEVGKRPQPTLSGFLLLDKLTTIEGGLPIMAGKDLVGAIGISGAPGGDKGAGGAQGGGDKISKSLGGAVPMRAL